MGGRKANKKFAGFDNPGNIRSKNKAIVRYEKKKSKISVVTQGCTGETCNCE